MRILWIGDSILLGMARHMAEAYAEMWPDLDPEVRIEAVEGWSTARWLRDGNVPGLIAEFDPFLVVIALGTNDEGEESAPERYAANIRRLSEQAAANGAGVLWIGAWTGTGIHERFRIIESVMEDLAIDGSKLMPGVSMSNEIHPDADGYALLARRAVQSTRWYLEAPRPVRISTRSSLSFAVPVLVGAAAAAILLALRS